MEAPETRYAIAPDGIYIAYQAVGEGPVDLVWQLDLFGNVDLVWETELGDWFAELAFVLSTDPARPPRNGALES